MSKSFQKSFQRTVWMAVCLSLQGCSFWTKKASTEPTVASTTTLMGESSSTHRDTGYSNARIRAVPRRPEPTETEHDVADISDTESTMYVVCKGDTLTSIARRFHVSVLQLMQENQLKNKNKLKVGQLLSIPQGSASMNVSYRSTPAESLSGETYCVQKGDTLYSIARRFHVSVDQIQQANSLADKNRLSVGQNLILPQGHVAGKENRAGIQGSTYVVQKGDTLTRIANHCGTTVAQLRELNHLTKDIIYVGQTLTVSGKAASKSGKKTAAASTSTLSGDTYTVQSGDTLWSISKRCHVSVSELARFNPQINPDQLHIGQVLFIRGTASSSMPTEKVVSSTEASSDLFGAEPSPTEEVKGAAKEEDDFKDLFEENKDMPIVPVDEKHE